MNQKKTAGSTEQEQKRYPTTSFFEWLTEQLPTVTADDVVLAAPTKPVGEGEVVLGVANEMIQRLHALHYKLTKAYESRRSKINPLVFLLAQRRPPVIDELLKERISLNCLYETLWNEVRVSYSLLSLDEVGFRAGFQVIKAEKAPNLADGVEMESIEVFVFPVAELLGL